MTDKQAELNHVAFCGIRKAFFKMLSIEMSTSLPIESAVEVLRKVGGQRVPVHLAPHNT